VVPLNPRYTRLIVNGTTRFFSDPDGWDFDSDTGAVTLLGAACDEAQAGAIVSIQNECPLLLI
jgi:hypothetical protein